jgi:hypothetical protein
MKNAIRAMMWSEITVSSSERTTISSTITPMIRNPRSVGFISLQSFFRSASGHVRAHGERRCEQRSSGEPEQPASRLAGRVEPGREDGAEGQRPVRVVEVVAGAPLVREQEEAERHLRHEQRLREGDQLAEGRAWLATAPVDDRGPHAGRRGNADDEQTDERVRRQHAARLPAQKLDAERVVVRVDGGAVASGASEDPVALAVACK